MVEMYGWVGKILRVDLTGGNISEVPTENYVPKFLGGRGLGMKIYWDEVPAGISAFSPQNKLIFTTGPLTGTLAPTSGRLIVVGKSPFTYTEEHYCYSAAGGNFGPELKYAGYDAIIVEGKAANPVYVWISDGDAEIRDATDLWRLGTYKTRQRLFERHGKRTRTMTIGPASENMCRSSGIIVDTGCFGQGGYGGVMGYKNLKAVACRGTGAVKVANPEDLKSATKNLIKMMSITEKEYREGKPWPALWLQRQNPTGGRYEPGMRQTKLHDDAAHGLGEVGFHGCFNCPSHCMFSFRTSDNSLPPGSTTCVSMGVWSSQERSYYGGKNRGRIYWEAITIHDDWNINAFEVSRVTSFIQTLAAKGILTEENTGIPLDEWGSRDSMLALFTMWAYREGKFGELIGEGLPRCAAYMRDHPEEFGITAEQGEEAWVEVLKQYPRGRDLELNRWSGWQNHWFWGYGPDGRSNHVTPISIMGWAVDVRGYSTKHDMTYVYNVGRNPWLREYIPFGSDAWFAMIRDMGLHYFNDELALDIYDWDHKAKVLVWNLNMAMEKDSMILCDGIFPNFVSLNKPAPHYTWIANAPELFPAVTGLDWSQDDIWAVGNRLCQLERAICVREGRTREDDWFNDYHFDPLKTAPDGRTVVKEEFYEVMSKYYQARGWDTEHGWPTRSALEATDLKDVADQLGRLGKLGT